MFQKPKVRTVGCAIFNALRVNVSIYKLLMFSLRVSSTVAESRASQIAAAAAAAVVVASRPKLMPAADEVPKKKDGRGRPRKDRTLELAKSSTAVSSGGTPVSSAPV